MNRQWLLQCGVVGNHALFWRKGHHGYTTNIHEAHRFTKEEAAARHRERCEDVPVHEDVVMAGAELCYNPTARVRSQEGKA